jgi:IPT/TIG domain.
MATPTVTSLSPATGPAGGGTLVALTGTGFANAMLVGFGATMATSIAVLSDTSLVAASPSGTGNVNVTVVTPGGISAAAPAAQFAYTGTPPSPAAPPVDPALTAQVVGTLLSMIQANNSPDAAAAQSIILRRLALQGDVVGSRVPAPRNITEIGGYFNMLETLGESAMREQTLASILGVAGPVPSLTSLQPQPLSMVNVTNDRPDGRGTSNSAAIGAGPQRFRQRTAGCPEATACAERSAAVCRPDIADSSARRTWRKRSCRSVVLSWPRIDAGAIGRLAGRDL